jgi:hypothetical protein
MGLLRLLDEVDDRSAAWARRRPALIAALVVAGLLAFGLAGMVVDPRPGAAGGVAFMLLALVLAQPVLLYLLARKAENDMQARGLDGRPYSLLIFFVPVIGIAYWLRRRSAP